MGNGFNLFLMILTRIGTNGDSCNIFVTKEPLEV